MGIWEELAAVHLTRPTEKTLEALVEHEWPYVQRLARLMARQMCQSLIGEAESAGAEGLMVAARTYNGNSPWRAWLRLKVKAAIIDLVRRDDPVPRSTRNLITALDRCAEDLRPQLRREPTLDETLAAHAAHGPVQRTSSWLLGDLRTVSLSAPENPDGESTGTDWSPAIAAEPMASEDAIAMSALERWIDDLDPRRAEVMRRSLEGERKREIASDLGLTPSRVSQIWHEAARTLRRRAVSEGWALV